MKRHKLLFFILAAFLVALTATATAWTYTSANYTFPITKLGTGEIGTVTFVNQLYFDLSGKEVGLELYKIDLGSPTLSNQVKIHVLLLDYDKLKSIISTSGWLDIAIWYPDGGGTNKLADGTVVSRLDSTRYQMTQVNGNACLVSTVTMQSTLYVMGNITTNSDNNPPGQQAKLQGEVAASVAFFFCEVRTL